jgi:hypothetical protein
LQKLNADSSVVETSASVQVTTMDTTSHSFQFSIDTLGVTSSVLYDVAIINDTLAYAVGEMYLRDSTGQIDPQAWNAAKWNGQRWELRRIPFIGPCSAVLYPPLKAIWVFSATNILVTNGGSIVRYDGVNATMDCGMNSLLAGAINKIYGVSPQDVYAVGNVGTIVHYNGSTWQRLESGTGLDIVDVFGSTNQSVKQILAVASRAYATRDRAILHIDALSGQATTLSDSGITQPLEGIWFVGGRIYYVVGSGIYRRWSVTSHESWRALHTGVTPNYSYSVRGTAMNDLIVVGAFGDVIHFNGLNWKVIQELRTNGNFYRVAVTSRLVVAIGFRGGREVVVRGYR